MNTILKALWRGEISPQERFFSKGSQYHSLLEKVCAEQKALLSTLSQEGKAHLESYESALWQLQSESEEEVFVQGFRLGALMMLDIIQPEERGNTK